MKLNQKQKEMDKELRKLFTNSQKGYGYIFELPIETILHQRDQAIYEFALNEFKKGKHDK